MDAIAINGLCKTYRGKRLSRVNALKGIDLTVARGEVFGFLGPNGAGKSTTIKVLTGQIRADQGQAWLMGTSVADSGARRNLGYLPENPAFYDSLTAREYLGFVGRTFKIPHRKIVQETERVLKLMSLDGAADRPIRGFSKGMVQRLGLAQTLLHDPDLYILDEPMSGLDPLGRALVKNVIKGLKDQGKTVFFSTHITADVEAVCDRVGIIVKGKLRAVDRVEHILQEGVEGYQIQVTGPNGDCRQLTVSREGMREKMGQILKEGGMIERIEPLRKDLEGYFLDVVEKAENEAD